MKSRLRTALRSVPDLYVLLKPFAMALRLLFRGPGAHSCVTCFPAFPSCPSEKLEQILGVLDRQETVSFIQVGSNDGKSNDPLHRHLAASDRWRGILVEPHPDAHSRLRTTYSGRDGLAFERLLVSNRNTKKRFYSLSGEARRRFPDLPAWSDQLGSFKPSHIVDHLGDAFRPFVVSEDLEAITLETLLERHGIRHLDLLHVDTEGHEYAIVGPLDLARWRPAVMIVEYKHLRYLDCYRLIRKLRRHYVLLNAGDDFVAVDRRKASLFLGPGGAAVASPS